MCRLIAPAEDYMRAFAPALKMAQLAWRCAGVMFSAPLISFHKAVPRVSAESARPASISCMLVISPSCSSPTGQVMAMQQQVGDLTA